ncbi:hypothetical protein EXU30_14450 [Shewanella maritima]|uniref:MFS transporter n=1 Tax=Shewanella maritima TaxID=2520507 RepID=A0A411PJM0_9GAMM|nr:MFS transporter [Shewanella maritima]QBF83759.1 hypothetical protein EXU30_14450 [Shewanella maritima]
MKFIGQTNSNKWLIASIKMAIASSVFQLLPLYLDAISRHLSLSPFEITYIATIEILGFALASFICFIAKKTKSFEIKENVALMVLVVSHVLSALVTAEAIFFSLRLVAGISAGVVIVKTYEVLANEPNPDVAFGKAMAVQMCYAALMFVCLPSILHGFGFDSLFYIFAAAAFLMLLVPASPDFTINHAPSQTPTEAAQLLKGLAALFLFSLTHSGVWSILAVLGQKLSIEPQAQGNALAVGTIISLFGALLAAWIGKGKHKTQALMLCVVCQLGIITLLFNNQSQFGYFIYISVFMFLWNTILPLFIGTISIADKQGQVIGFMVAAQTIGAAIGPSALVHGWIVVEMSVLILVSVFLLYPLLPKAKCQNQSN